MCSRGYELNIWKLETIIIIIDYACSLVKENVLC